MRTYPPALTDLPALSLLASLILTFGCGSDRARMREAQAPTSPPTPSNLAAGEASPPGESGEVESEVESGSEAESEVASSPEAARQPFQIAESPQRDGDARRGYDILVNDGYVSCGVPYSAYRTVFGRAPAHRRIRGRRGHNADLPYSFTATSAPSGVEVVVPNCLTCHAARLNGRLIVGLGAHASNFTGDPTYVAGMAGQLIRDPAERGEWRRWEQRVRAVGPQIQMDTIGPTSADNLAAVLMAHKDPVTLEWFPVARIPVPQRIVPLDVPAWWLMRDKHAMFATGAGQGDHARLMMSASMLCTDSVEEAERIDARFVHVRAYIQSLNPPRFQGRIDGSLRRQGASVYAERCAGCHGTYGPEGTLTYPNLVIPVDQVGTDSMLAGEGGYFGRPYREWFAESFWGQRARLENTGGYVAPPLRGVWATAPYLHNGSVPTLRALLDSSQRPRYWTRDYWDDTYDRDAVGWPYRALDHGKRGAANPNEALEIYDTSLPGYSNGGHTYADSLSPEDRRALLEYLKTL